MGLRGKILKLLMQNPKGFVSGQEMAEILGVSRAAINKHIDKLKAAGCEIECKRNAGYRLLSVSDKLLPEVVEIYRFADGEAPYTIRFYETVESTNRTAMMLFVGGAEHGTVVVADRQTNGRGRLGRAWTSPGEDGLYFSILLCPRRLAAQEAQRLSIIAAIAVARAVTMVSKRPHVAIKWPNDILIDGKKVCGILNEMQVEVDTVTYAIIGIGINVNNESFPDELQLRATSMFLETGRKTPRAQLLAAVLTEFFDIYDAVYQTREMSFAQVMQEYNSWSACIGKEITVTSPRTSFNGLCKGFDDDGSMLLQDDGGNLHHIASGDVTLRPPEQA